MLNISQMGKNFRSFNSPMNIMSSSSLKLIFLCILVCFFNSISTEAQETDIVLVSCSENNSTTTANSHYETNLRILLSSLTSEATTKTFYNNTVLGSNSSDTVYGLFMCRGDIPSDRCSHCVVNATETLSSNPNCSLSKQGLIYFEVCMVRYSNVSFFSTVDTSPGWYVFNNTNTSSNLATFMNLLSYTMNQTAEAAAFSANKFFTKRVILPPSQTIYCLAQCTPDLSPQNCTACLAVAIIWNLPDCCPGKVGRRLLLPSCNIRYELYPFYRLPADDEVPPQGGGGFVPMTR